MPGTYQARISITDSQNLVYNQTLAVVVNDEAGVDQLLRALWADFNSALSAGKTAQALQYMNLQARAKYGPIFEALLPDLPQIVASYSPLQKISISSEVGEYAVNRTLDGRDRIFFVYFLLDGDGVWRLDSM